jgi:hypothetical protein
VSGNKSTGNDNRDGVKRRINSGNTTDAEYCGHVLKFYFNIVNGIDEITGGWRKLHNEKLHNLYSSPSIIRMIESRRMRWAEHVARMGEKRIQKERDQWEDQDLGG